MTLNFATPAQNIICFDLLNSTWEETYASSLDYDYIGYIIEFIHFIHFRNYYYIYTLTL